jgi:hypothetical protein
MTALVMSLLLVAIAGPTAVQGIGNWMAKRPGSVEATTPRANAFTPLIGAPTNLTVTATSSVGISLSWTAPAGNVIHYEVERSENNSQPFVLLANAADTAFTDSNVTNLRTYLYRVRAVETGASCVLVSSAPSNMVMGTAASFEFSNPQNQPIRAQHFHDVRNAVNAVRAAANLAAATWLRSNLTNLDIKATDVQEVRDRLTEALNLLSIPVSFTDPTLSTGTTTIKAIHLDQLQTKATRGVSNGSGRPALLSDRAVLGEFAAPISLDLVPVHMNVLPNGKVLFWGRDRFKNGDVVTEASGASDAYVWDPDTKTGTKKRNEHTNLFCSGHSFLPDGRLLVSGGHKDENVDGDGEPHTNIFDFRKDGSWVNGPNMNKGRWYPYNVMLGSGNTLILSGTYFTIPHVLNSQKINTMPQVYNFNNGCIDDLQDMGSTETNFFTAYPFLHLRPDGKVLQIQSPVPVASAFDRRSRLFNPNPVSGETPWPFLASTNDDHGLASAVTFDSGRKVLIVGGFTVAGAHPNNKVEYISLQGGTSWTSVAPMNFKRAYHVATILPDGKILVTGGTSCSGGNNVNCPDRAAMNAEMWDATAFSPGSPNSVRWRTMARYSEIRAYHSVAALLPDGRVMVAGGGRPGAVGEYYPDCSQIEDFTEANAKMFGHANVEIYSPPYLFDANGNEAARPEIISAPPVISYGQSYFLNTSGHGPAPKVSLVRLASVTHGFNQDQRQMFLGETGDPPLQVFSTGISITLPNDSNRFPPGYYMLFVLNNGVPSIAKIVRLGSTSIFLTEAPDSTGPALGQSWEQGVEFSSSVSGQITHIRFWKDKDEDYSGHIGHIWNASTGQELATATFTCETDSGWQQAPLATPLQITPGTRYKVTYNVRMFVAKTFNVFNGPIPSGPLTAWGSSFATPEGTFPTTGSTSNLFADVVFKPGP